jgi:hypothetical protein
LDDGRGLSKNNKKELALGACCLEDRDRSNYLDDWTPLESIRAP